MEKSDEAEGGRLLVHDFHEVDVAVGGGVGDAVDGRHLVLGRGDLVVTDGERAADAEHLGLHSLQELLDARGRRREVVEVALLVARRERAEQGAAAVDEIGALLEVLGAHDEELLLPPEVGGDRFGVTADLQVLQKALRLAIHRVHRPQQGRLVVEALARASHQRARDSQSRPRDEERRGPVPRRVRRRLVRHAQTAARETRAVRLAAKQPLGRERRLERLAGAAKRPVEVDERVRLQRPQHPAHRARPAAPTNVPHACWCHLAEMIDLQPFEMIDLQPFFWGLSRAVGVPRARRQDSHREEPVRKTGRAESSGPQEDGVSNDLRALWDHHRELL